MKIKNSSLRETFVATFGLILPTLIPILASVQAGANTVATVNLQEGSFLYQTEEVWAPNLRLHWHYSSRSVAQGLLGLGWCGQIEWRLQVRAQNAILIKCDDFEVLSSKPKQTPFGFELKTKDHTLVFSAAGELTVIKQHTTSWHLHRNLKGQVVTLQDSQGSSIQLQYSSPQEFLRKIKSTSIERRYDFQKGQVTTVTSTSTSTSTSTERRRSPASEQVTYKYDNLNNLVQILEVDKQIDIQYEPLRDIALRLKNNGCDHQYSYQTKAASDLIQDTIEIESDCKGQPKTKKRETFQYQVTTDQILKLKQRISENLISTKGGL